MVSLPILRLIQMKLDEFRVIFQKARRAKPKLFLMILPDPAASEQALNVLEAAIGVRLPDSYRSFLREFGGGNFGLTSLFSADPKSDWYLGAKLEEARGYLPTDLLAFSDDFAGGLYVFEVVAGQAMEPVLYWNHDGGVVRSRYTNVLEFVARNAF